MFTGLIEALGTVTAIADHGAQSQLTISTPGWAHDLTFGESIAVNGVCLTVAKFSADDWVADVMKVTKDFSTLGSVKVGDRVNLERAMQVGDRLGGHMVQGHVDGVATMVARDSQADWEDLSFELPEHLLRYVVHKGSITINGVSLTVAHLDGTVATVSLIPTTLAETNLGDLGIGSKVNIEVDVIAKYVEKMLGERS